MAKHPGEVLKKHLEEALPGGFQCPMCGHREAGLAVHTMGIPTIAGLDAEKKAVAPGSMTIYYSGSCLLCGFTALFKRENVERTQPRLERAD